MSGEWAYAEFLGAARFVVCVCLPGSCGRGVSAAWGFLESRELTWHESTWGGGVVEEDGAQGGGVVRGDSEGLFKGLVVGLAVFRRCWQPPHGKPR